MKSFVFFLVGLFPFCSGSVFSDPINTSTKPILFCVERTASADKVIYEVNLDKNGNLNRDRSIKVYWKRFTKNGEEEPLLWVQKKFGYGVKVISETASECKFHLAAFKTKEIVVKRSQKEDKFKAYTNINGEEVEISKLFVDADGGSFMAPNIKRVELFGITVEGKEVKEILK